MMTTTADRHQAGAELQLWPRPGRFPGAGPERPAHPGDRQLRFLHLQPGAVPGGDLGDQDPGVPQRRDHGGRHPRGRGPPTWSSRPGPCTPDEAGISLEAIARAWRAYARSWGSAWATSPSARSTAGEVIRGEAPVHGKTSLIHHDRRTIFAGLPQPFVATRYHSLVRATATLPPMLECSAWTAGRRDHGRAAPGVRGGGRAVPPREPADRGRQGPAAQLPAAAAQARWDDAPRAGVHGRRPSGGGRAAVPAGAPADGTAEAAR